MKYPNKCFTEVVKLLFHGSKNTDPKLIYGTENGLDLRFAKNGVWGQGIYFANNSRYSLNYSHPVPGQ